MAPTRPLSLNKYDGAELSNAAAMGPFRYITWPTTVFRHDNTLKGSKIHRYNDISEIAKTPISLSSSSSSSSENRHNSKSAWVFIVIFAQISFFLAGVVPFTKKNRYRNITKSHAHCTSSLSYAIFICAGIVSECAVTGALQPALHRPYLVSFRCKYLHPSLLVLPSPLNSSLHYLCRNGTDTPWTAHSCTVLLLVYILLFLYNEKPVKQESKNISTKMLKDVGMTVPKSRETSAICSNTGGEGSIFICSKTGWGQYICSKTGRDEGMQQ